ncbi:hypothetical protein EMCRGX_G034139 [Ephydatia muelleri]
MGVAGTPFRLQDISHHKELGSRTSLLLGNPDYLLEGYVEKRCQYIGEMDDVPMSTDMSDRNFLLSTLDEQRNSGKLSWVLDSSNNVSLSLSAYNVKISKDRAGPMLHRIPIHEVASVSYVCDDDQNLLFIKAGDPTNPYAVCHVLCFSKQADATEVCTILQQAFHVVYTESTMRQLDQSINAGEGNSGSTAVKEDSSKLLTESVRYYPREIGGREGDGGAAETSRPNADLRQRADNMGSNRPVTHNESAVTQEPLSTIPPSPSNHTATPGGPTAEELVQQYMERLHKLLDVKELREFASLLKSYRENMPVNEFCSKLKELYGQERMFLFPDMNSFIPEPDRPSFEEFLHQYGLSPAKSSQYLQETKPNPPTHDTLPSNNYGKYLEDVNTQMNSILNHE